jgi:hypothetical protein
MLMMVKTGSAMPLPFNYSTTDICYVSLILATFQLVVISFFNRGKFISLGLIFCIFVTNTIYVINKSWLQVVLMARYL